MGRLPAGFEIESLGGTRRTSLPPGFEIETLGLSEDEQGLSVEEIHRRRQQRGTLPPPDPRDVEAEQRRQQSIREGRRAGPVPESMREVPTFQGDTEVDSFDPFAGDIADEARYRVTERTEAPRREQARVENIENAPQHVLDASTYVLNMRRHLSPEEFPRLYRRGQPLTNPEIIDVVSRRRREIEGLTPEEATRRLFGTGDARLPTNRAEIVQEALPRTAEDSAQQERDFRQRIVAAAREVSERRQRLLGDSTGAERFGRGLGQQSLAGIQFIGSFAARGTAEALHNDPTGLFETPGDWMDSLASWIGEDAASRRAAGTPEYERGSLPYYAFGMSRTMLDLGAAVGVGLTTRNPGTTAGFIVGAMVGGEEAQRAEAAGFSRRASLAIGAIYGLTELGPEKIAVDTFLRAAREGGSVARRMGHRAAVAGISEGVQEDVTELLQIGLDVGVYNEQISLSEALERLKDAFIMGAGAGAGVGAAVAGGEAISDARQQRYQQRVDDWLREADRPEDTAPTRVGITERPPPVITSEDEASPLPTDLIATGKAAMDQATAGLEADAILGRNLSGSRGDRVSVEVGGQTRTGTIRDAFVEDDEEGVVIAWEDGSESRERFIDLEDAGAKIVAAPEPARQPPPARAEPGGAAPRGRGEPVERPGERLEGAGAREIMRQRIRTVESGGDDSARNPRSSASGRYQFTDPTFLSYHRRVFGGNLTDQQRLAQKNDPAVQERLMDALLDDNEQALRRGGHEITPGNLYLSHFLGSGGANSVLRNPDAPIEQIVGQGVVNANPFLRGMTGRDVAEWAASRMGGTHYAGPDSETDYDTIQPDYSWIEESAIEDEDIRPVGEEPQAASASDEVDVALSDRVPMLRGLSPEQQYEIARERSEPMNDIRGGPTGWRRLPSRDPDRVLLVSESEEQNRLFEGRDAFARAQAFAIDNPTLKPIGGGPAPELVSRPIFGGDTRPAPAETGTAEDVDRLRLLTEDDIEIGKPATYSGRSVINAGTPGWLLHHMATPSVTIEGERGAKAAEPKWSVAVSRYDGRGGSTKTQAGRGLTKQAAISLARQTALETANEEISARLAPGTEPEPQIATPQPAPQAPPDETTARQAVQPTPEGGAPAASGGLANVISRAASDGVDLQAREAAKVINVEWITRDERAAKGAGERAMRRLSDYADKAGKAVRLETDHPSLVSYFQRLGFVAERESGGFTYMVRQPNEGSAATAKFDPAQHIEPLKAYVAQRGRSLDAKAVAKQLGLKPQQALRVLGALAAQPNSGIFVAKRSGMVRRIPRREGPVSLYQFLRDRGGVKQGSHDLAKGRGLSRYPGLLNKNGMTLDDAVEATVEAGYFQTTERQDVSIDDLLQRLERASETYRPQEQAEAEDRRRAKQPQPDEDERLRRQLQTGLDFYSHEGWTESDTEAAILYMRDDGKNHFEAVAQVLRDKGTDTIAETEPDLAEEEDDGSRADRPAPADIAQPERGEGAAEESRARPAEPDERAEEGRADEQIDAFGIQPGDERRSLERKGEGRKKSTAEQKPPGSEGGLFDTRDTTRNIEEVTQAESPIAAARAAIQQAMVALDAAESKPPPEVSPEPAVTRRDFIKGAAAVAGGFAINERAPAQPSRWQARYALPNWRDLLTRLSPQQEMEFQRWARRTGAPITDDYDMRGFWLSGERTEINRVDRQPHYPDRFKTPLHESFSAESMFADPATNPPTWNDRDQLVASDGTVLFDERDQPMFQRQLIGGDDPVDRRRRNLAVSEDVSTDPRNVEVARVRRLGGDETALPESASEGLHPLWRERNYGSSALGGGRELSELSGRYGAASDASTLARQDRRTQGIRAEQRQVGDPESAGSEQARINTTPDAQRADEGADRVGEGTRDTEVNNLAATSQRRDGGRGFVSDEDEARQEADDDNARRRDADIGRLGEEGWDQQSDVEGPFGERLAAGEGAVAAGRSKRTAQEVEARSGFPLFSQLRRAISRPVSDADAKAIAERLQLELDRLGISDRISLRAANGLLTADQAQGSYFRKVIQVSLDMALNPEATLNHEAIHAMRALGLFTSSEWTDLVKQATQSESVMAFVEAADRERKLKDSQRKEEAVAEYYSRWRTQRMEAKGFVRQAFQRIADFFRAVGRAAALVLGRDPGTGGVLRQIESGKIGRRATGEGVFAEDIKWFQSDRFWKWFGSSRVVDENGAPLIVYHATGTDFDSFRTPAYFSATRKEAAGFGGNRVVSAYLAISNPKVIDNYPDFSAWGKEEVAAAKAEGFDGAMYAGDAARPQMWIAFEPSQIKSTANIGTFDPADDRIMFQTRTPPSLWNDMLNGARSVTGAAKIPGKSDKFWAAFDRLRTNMQDRMLPILRTQTAIERDIGRELSEEERPYRQEALYTGRVGAQFEQLEDDLLAPLFEQMSEDNVSVEELESYLYARHAPERNAKLKQEGVDNGSGMSDIEAAAILSRIGKAGKTEALERVAVWYDKLIGFALDTRVAGGLMSPETAAEWRAQWKHYAPLRGQAELGEADERPKTGKGFTVRGPESKRAFGRKSKASDLLAFAVVQAEEAVIRAEKNQVATDLYNLAKANPDDNFWKIQKVSMRKRVNKETGLIESYPVTVLLPEDAPYTVSVKLNGKQSRITFNKGNPAAVRAAAAMRRLDEPELNFRALQLVNQWLSKANTMLNPDFIWRNALRDMETAVANLTQFNMKGLRRDVLASYPKAVKAAERGAFKRGGNSEWDKAWREFTAEGGRVYYNNVQDVDELRDEMNKRFRRLTRPRKLGPKDAGLALWEGLKWTFDKIEKANLGVENAMRLSAYKNLRDRGVSKKEAAFIAKELTTNFNRRGVYGVLMNSLFLFMNATTQGSTRMLLALRHRRTQKIAAMMVAAGAMNTLYNVLVSAGDDDDEESVYDRISEYEKSTNMIFMIPGSDRYIKIPVAYGYNVFPEIGRHLVEIFRGRETPIEASGNWLFTALHSFNPIGGNENFANFIAPTVVDPAVDILVDNRDFADRPIMPDQSPFEPPVPDSQRYWPSVSPIFRRLTDALNTGTGGDEVVPGWVDVSPETLEYLTSYVTGAAGATIMRFGGGIGKALDGDPETVVEINDVPVARTMVGAPPRWYQKAAFYTRLDHVEETVSHAREYAGNRDVEGLRAYARSERDVLELRQEARAARREIREIRRARAQLDIAAETGRITDDQRARVRARLMEREERLFTAFDAIYLRVVEDPRRPER